MDRRGSTPAGAKTLPLNAFDLEARQKYWDVSEIRLGTHKVLPWLLLIWRSDFLHVERLEQYVLASTVLYYTVPLYLRIVRRPQSLRSLMSFISNFVIVSSGRLPKDRRELSRFECYHLPQRTHKKQINRSDVASSRFLVNHSQSTRDPIENELKHVKWN